MFQPVFVYDSHYNTQCVLPEYAERKGFRLVDIRDVGNSVHGGNPPVVVYDGDGFMTSRVPEGERRFDPPKKTGIMVMFSSNKGHVHGLPNPREFVEWFFDKKVAYWNGLTGNFRVYQ